MLFKIEGLASEDSLKCFSSNESIFFILENLKNHREAAKKVLFLMAQKSSLFLNGWPFTPPPPLPLNGLAIKRRTFFLRLPLVILESGCRKHFTLQ